MQTVSHPSERRTRCCACGQHNARPHLYYCLDCRVKYPALARLALKPQAVRP